MFDEIIKTPLHFSIIYSKFLAETAETQRQHSAFFFYLIFLLNNFWNDINGRKERMSTVETDLENELRFWILQKQPPSGVLKKRCTGNMLQIYRRTPMPKCDFNKVASQFYWNRTWVWVYSCKIAAYFQNSLEGFFCMISELNISLILSFRVVREIS